MFNLQIESGKFRPRVTPSWLPLTFVYKNCGRHENLLSPPPAYGSTPLSNSLPSHNGVNRGVCCQKLDQTKAASNIDWFRLSMKAAGSSGVGGCWTPSVTSEGGGHRGHIILPSYAMRGWSGMVMARSPESEGLLGWRTEGGGKPSRGLCQSVNNEDWRIS